MAQLRLLAVLTPCMDHTANLETNTHWPGPRGWGRGHRQWTPTSLVPQVALAYTLRRSEGMRHGGRSGCSWRRQACWGQDGASRDELRLVRSTQTVHQPLGAPRRSGQPETHNVVSHWELGAPTGRSRPSSLLVTRDL